MMLKINKSSVALSLVPNIPSRFDEITKFVFGVKQTGAMEDDALAESARDVALESDDLAAWITDLRERVLSPAPRP